MKLLEVLTRPVDAELSVVVSDSGTWERSEGNRKLMYVWLVSCACGRDQTIHSNKSGVSSPFTLDLLIGKRISQLINPLNRAVCVP
jgi:hypothetical protein